MRQHGSTRIEFELEKAVTLLDARYSCMKSSIHRWT